MYYSYAQFDGRDLGFFRLPPGAGLANLLFPWARFIVATRKYNLTPLCPTWFQLQVGPSLRGQTDKRFYHDLFHTPKEQISSFKKLYLINSLKRISGRQFITEIASRKNFSHQNLLPDQLPDQLVVFGGRYRGFFADILQDHKLVLQELLNITRQKHKQGLKHDFSGSISIHVRLGDFFAPNRELTLKSSLCHQLPITWYVQQIQQIRQHTQRNVPIYVFSDGKDAQLAEILELPNVQRLGFGSSIADMLAMARSNVFIGSGSTFSMWASYLGRMPVIWHKGQHKQRLYYEEGAIEAECDANGRLAADILDRLAMCLRQKETVIAPK